MSKGRMLAVSMLITVCFVSLSAVLLFFLSDEGLAKVKQNKEQSELKIALAEQSNESQLDEGGYIQQGIQLVETEDAIYDVMFDYETSDISLKNGPMRVNVTNVLLEEIRPISEKKQKILEGMEKATVVRLQVESTNTSSLPVNFDLSTITVDSDAGESSRIDQVLSDRFSTVYTPGETKKGELVIMFESRPDLLATIWLNVRSPFNENGDELGENTKLKVNLF